MMFNIFEIIKTSRSTEPRTGVISARLISDSIILWGEADEITLGFICALAGQIEEAALKHGFLVRGAVVSGKHFAERPQVANLLDGTCQSEDEIILSPALVQAVNIEKNKRHPGIVLNHSIQKFIKIRRRPPKSGNKKQFSVPPIFGEAIKLVADDSNNTPSCLSKKDREIAISDLKKFQKIIKDGLRKTKSNKASYRKWKVIAKQFNTVAKKVSERLNVHKDRRVKV